MSNAADRLYRIALAHAAKQSLRECAQTYRDCAEVLAHPKDAAELVKMAKDIDAILKRHQQLDLDLGVGGNE